MTELRLAGITTIDEADAFLPGWLIRHNARFAVPPADPAPAWRAWPEGLSAEAVFAFWYRRTVARDNTISWGRALSLPRRSDGRTRAGRGITIAERLDGSLWAELEGIWRPLVDAPPSAPELRARKARRAGASEVPPDEDQDAADVPADDPPSSGTASGPWRPAGDHPWRRRLKPG